jgi:hypothetical protein
MIDCRQALVAWLYDVCWFTRKKSAVNHNTQAAYTLPKIASIES